ncbi:TetR/AcrR family transcriptional regulator [Lysinibacillus sp. KU-BSD001]|uniref:TetR/AcrR family transcriptional regulator n=1 Tax=Lysinibacillus sp. KU-BSD001 TaxID=3141328 RepID=UPI0036EC8C6B
MPKILVTEEQWVQKGIEYFSQGGFAALVVEKMARELKCSKSSFYWYFTDRDEFLRRVIELWTKRATIDVIFESSKNMTTEIQIRTVLEKMFSNENVGDFLFYLRRLGQEKDEYREVLTSIENMRLSYMTKLLQQLEISEEKAKIKASLIYHYYLGWYERHKYKKVSSKDMESQILIMFEEIIG